MGTIAQKMQAVANSKSAIKQALINKGRSPSDKLNTYASEINSLVLGVPNLCGTLTFGGTYATATYFTEAGCSMGFNDKEEVFLMLQGGTSTAYENIIFTLASAPAGVTMAQSQVYTHASNPAKNHYGCKLMGVTKKINVSVNFSSINASYDYVVASLTVMYA